MFGRSSRTTGQGTDVEDRNLDGRHVDDDAPVERGVDPATAQAARKERFGGMNGGAAFFGWLVAVAVSVLLIGIIGAIAAAVGSNAQITQSQAQSRAGDIGLAAVIALLVVLMIGYYCGGYVAGRMSRFSGGAQGLGVWIIGLVVSILMIVLGAVFGQQYDVLSRVNLPRLPVSSDDLTTTGVIAAIVLLVATLAAALLGGAAGTRYHRRVDRVGWDA